ncbi:TMEM175 family protein [Sphingomonas oligophenolica]|uniref:DUF1211 domain-containing protein n=1 Tax=Sphingomonas oligophenolica TaxID=301154 RepID=A0A502CRJ5_9SPHN|nr:TMEM175 family protein [Sphingomonas oligophenolica]TPG15453.1 DUF1211 domain-containing protein [Sphingomonas oligophenolica]
MFGEMAKMGTINKERFVLFSDGVFAIILTLLVLDLKVPESLGLAGLRTATPGLLVHAGAFFVIGMAWITHHHFLEHVERIGSNMLGYNLLVLFWITLVPFGARTAAEHPYDGLGAAIMVASIALNLASLLLMAWFGDYESVTHDPIMQPLRRRRGRYFLAYLAIALIVTMLCFDSPWFGYGFLMWGASVLWVAPPSVVHARLVAEENG